MLALESAAQIYMQTMEMERKTIILSSCHSRLAVHAKQMQHNNFSNIRDWELYNSLRAGFYQFRKILPQFLHASYLTVYYFTDGVEWIISLPSFAVSNSWLAKKVWRFKATRKTGLSATGKIPGESRGRSWKSKLFYFKIFAAYLRKHLDYPGVHLYFQDIWICL